MSDYFNVISFFIHRHRCGIKPLNGAKGAKMKTEWFDRARNKEQHFRNAYCVDWCYLVPLLLMSSSPAFLFFFIVLYIWLYCRHHHTYYHSIFLLHVYVCLWFSRLRNSWLVFRFSLITSSFSFSVFFGSNFFFVYIFSSQTIVRAQEIFFLPYIFFIHLALTLE